MTGCGTGRCGCSCHRFPGTKHVVACCDQPPAPEPLDLLTREELEARKLRILQLWDGIFMQRDDECCAGCTENNIWITYGEEAAALWRELQEIRAVLGERETPRWTC